MVIGGDDDDDDHGEEAYFKNDEWRDELSMKKGIRQLQNSVKKPPIA